MEPWQLYLIKKEIKMLFLPWISRHNFMLSDALLLPRLASGHSHNYQSKQLVLFSERVLEMFC